ncbi:unnamed protein product [marine sediment metagenome]|uniref:Poly A polymerase head domain-containing protein n=1 Tax=marine sediment metagenome TaxID=412755 RepID=X0S086_9ZZZZ
MEYNTATLGNIVPILHEVSKVVPDLPWCVAGGAVRDLVLNQIPKDYDVFTYQTKDTPDKEIDRIVVAFREAGYQCSRKSASSYAMTAVEMFGSRVEICMDNHPTPIKLAQSFDWNVCLACAWMTEVIGEKKLAVWYEEDMLASVKFRHGSLRLLRDTTPDSTLRRGYNFAYRFGMKFHKEDQLHLAKKFLTYNGFNVTPV